jgi:hypothetical protein
MSTVRSHPDRAFAGAKSMDTIRGLVPEIYYDMIARVAAGVPLVAVLFAPPPDQLESVSNAASFVLLLGFGYIAGHLLTTISVFLNLLVWNPWILRRLKRGLLKDKIASDNPWRAFEEVYHLIDRTAKADPNAGAIMKKMEAGATLSDNLLSGWLVILAYQQFGGRVHWLIDPPWYPWVALMVTLGLVATVWFRRVAFILRQDSLLSALDLDRPSGVRA